MYKLIIKDDEGNKTVVAFYRQEMTIGRKEGNTIRLTEQNVSRYHARLFKSNNLVFIEDQNSYVGTLINGVEIKERTRIQHGDAINIGDYSITLVQEAQEGDEDTLLVSDGNTEAGSATNSSQQKIRPVPISEITGGKSTTHTAIIHADDIRPDIPENAYDLKAPYNRVVFQNMNWEGANYEISKSIMFIGRNSECDIIINHRSISEKHAQITCDGKSVKIKDLNSSNGILINGEKYGISQLSEGDIVSVGHVKFRFCDSFSKYKYSHSEKGKSNKLLFIIGGVVLVVVAVVTILLLSKNNTTKKEGEEKNKVTQNNNTDNKNDNSNNDTLNQDNKKEVKILSPELMNLLNTGEQLVKSQNWDKAKKVYESVLEKDPENSDVKKVLKHIDNELTNKKTYGSAMQLMHKKQFSDAKTSFDSIPAESSYYTLGQKKLEEMFEDIIVEVDKKISATKYDEARELLELANTIKEDTEYVIDRLTHIDKKTKKRVISNNSKDKNKYDREGAVKLVEEARKTSISDPKATIRKASEAIKLDPTYSESYLLAGFAYKTLKDNKQAVKILNQYLKLAPNAPNSSGIRNLIKTMSPE
ncbi:FHA domain-containing protein [bacterium]|nr:FHA domain-containing protein [bacterium]